MNKVRHILLAALALCLLSAFSASAEVEIFKLKDGVTVKCEIQYVTADSIVISQWLSQTGTQKKDMTYTWDTLSDESATYLKRKYGVPDVKAEGESRFMRSGKRITIIGAKPYEGFMIEEENTPKFIYLYTEGGKRIPIPRDQIENIEDIIVDLRNCLPPQKLYDMALEEHYPISPRDHFEIARYCEKIGAVKRAIVHYKKAIDGDVRFSFIVGGKIDDLNSHYRENFASALLEEAKAQYDRKKYMEAAAKLAQIIEYYPDTPAAKEAQDLTAKVQEALDMVIAKTIVDEYYRSITNKLRKRISGDVLDGQSKPGFRIVLKDNRAIEGEFCDENGNPLTPTGLGGEAKADNGDDYEVGGSQESSDAYIFIKDKRGIIIEIPKSEIKEYSPVELNKKTKKPTFTADHRAYLNGKDNELNREIRQELSLKYGVPERDIKEIWQNRAVERRDIKGKVLRENLSKKQSISYGKGTVFSPKLARENRLAPKFPVAQNLDEYFDSLSSSDKFNVLMGMYAENSMIIIEDSAKIKECPKCKGTGKGEKEESKPPAGTNPGERTQPGTVRQLGCDMCHGIGQHLSFSYK